MCGDFVAPVLVERLVEPISESAGFAMTCFTEDASDKVTLHFAQFFAKLLLKRLLKIKASVDRVY